MILYTVCQKTRSLHYCKKIFKKIAKCSTIQRENDNRGYAATIIATNVQKGIPFQRHKPKDVSIHQSPYRQLSAVRQTRLHSDTAAVDLSKVFKVTHSSLCLSFCWKFFCGPVSSKSSNSYRFLQLKCESPRIASSDVDNCNGNKVSWYPVLSKLISYIPKDCKLV